MNILLNKQGKVPIYEQIYQAISNQIISNKLLANNKLPSIRVLAKDLGVSVITTKRAYEDLERDGLIYTVVGRGTYVADQSANVLLEKYINDIEVYFKKIITLAEYANINEEKLLEIYRKVRGDK